MNRYDVPRGNPAALRASDFGEASYLPTLEQQRATADSLQQQNPTWTRTRCMQRALIEWQKAAGRYNTSDARRAA